MYLLQLYCTVETTLSCSKLGMGQRGHTVRLPGLLWHPPSHCVIFCFTGCVQLLHIVFSLSSPMCSINTVLWRTISHFSDRIMEIIKAHYVDRLATSLGTLTQCDPTQQLCHRFYFYKVKSKILVVSCCVPSHWIVPKCTLWGGRLVYISISMLCVYMCWHIIIAAQIWMLIIWFKNIFLIEI